jgi:hypothetical protein
VSSEQCPRSDLDNSFRDELEEAIAYGTYLGTDEHPMLLYAHWLEWHTKLFWSISTHLGDEEAFGFANAGGHRHVDFAEILKQVAYLRELLDRLD